MKVFEIENKELSIAKNQATEEKANYAYLLEQVLPSACSNGKGFDLQGMEFFLKMKSIFENANGVIKLEEADFRKIKTAVESMNWQIPHEELVEFIYYIKDLKPSKNKNN